LVRTEQKENGNGSVTHMLPT